MCCCLYKPLLFGSFEQFVALNDGGATRGFQRTLAKVSAPFRMFARNTTADRAFRLLETTWRYAILRRDADIGPCTSMVSVTSRKGRATSRAALSGIECRIAATLESNTLPIARKICLAVKTNLAQFVRVS
jgi:hypothetical protein